MGQTAWNDSHACQRNPCSPVSPISGRHITIQGSGGRGLQRLSLDSGLPSPTLSQFVKATLEGMQRILAKPTVKKDPVTSVMLEDMVKDANKATH